MTRRFWVRTTVAAALAAGLMATFGPQRAISQGQTTTDPLVFYALPNGSEEAPNPVNTPATGFARFVLSGDRTQLIYEVRAAGLTGNATAMHLHTGARGVAGPVAIGLA